MLDYMQGQPGKQAVLSSDGRHLGVLIEEGVLDHHLQSPNGSSLSPIGS